MNKLAKKFSFSIITILLIAMFCAMLFNTLFLEDYYVFQKKRDITQVSNDLIELLKANVGTDIAINKIEAKNKVIISDIGNEPIANNDVVNERIQETFRQKGVGFQKYWLWEDDYQNILKGKKQIRLYNQEKMNYSLLVEYIQYESRLYAITMIVPNVTDAFEIANTFLLTVMFSTILIVLALIILLIKKITRPLCAFEEFADHIRNNQFLPIEINTKDELDRVAESLNLMGYQVIQSQEELREKNEQMEQLLDDVAHELKTPISLIHLYGKGIEDGMDDGTFLPSILEETEKMTTMVERLLFLSRVHAKTLDNEPIQLSKMIENLMCKCDRMIEDRGLKVIANIEKDITILGERNLLHTIFMNLITNMIKYASSTHIEVSLYCKKDVIVFETRNVLSNRELDINKIWNAYYVGEISRNKYLSGTGLGLYIVRRICDEKEYVVNCIVEKQNIIFSVCIPIINRERRE